MLYSGVQGIPALRQILCNYCSAGDIDIKFFICVRAHYLEGSRLLSLDISLDEYLGGIFCICKPETLRSVGSVAKCTYPGTYGRSVCAKRLEHKGV